MEKQFKYVFNGEEKSKEQFIKLAKDSFKWLNDSSINAVDFDSVSSFFSGEYKSDNEIDNHFKSVLENQEKQYPNLGDYLNKTIEEKENLQLLKDSVLDDNINYPKQLPDTLAIFSAETIEEVKEIANNIHRVNFCKDMEKREEKVIEDWNRKDFYITPPSKENLDKMCESFEQRVKNDSDKCGILNKGIPECHSKIGQKHNEGKLPLDIMLTVQFPKAIQAVCKATLFGHEKYKDTDLDWLNYKRVRGGSTTYANACQRHNFNKSGRDDQSGLPHIVHKCWNALAELELWIEENKYE